MGTTDRVGNAGQEAEGVMQGTVGHLTGDRQLPAKGKAAEAVSDIKQAVETVKGGLER